LATTLAVGSGRDECRLRSARDRGAGTWPFADTGRRVRPDSRSNADTEPPA